jgi:transposase
LVEQSFRFVLAPVREQAPALDCWLGASRYWFNAGLAEVKDRLDRRVAGEDAVDLPWSYKGLCSVLDAAWRNERAPWQAEHHLTTFLTRRYGVIGAETLNVKGMVANKRLARHISDVGWGLILSQLKYKTGWSEGSILALADRFYPSSKTCSACGAAKTKLDLSERVFTCDACGHVQDRDVNAGLNLAHIAEVEAEAQGRTGLVIVTPPTAQVGRGATDLEKRRSRRGSQATATNRASQDPPENRRAA